YHFGYISRVDRGKGWETFIHALYELSNTFPSNDFRALVVGSGSELAELKKTVSLLKLDSTVDIRPPVIQRDLPLYYNQIEAFVFPTTLEESLGLVGLESMACGTPVIGSNIGGLKSYIDDGV